MDIYYHELFFVYKLKINKNHYLYKNKLRNLDSENNYYKFVLKDNLLKENLLPKELINTVKSDSFDMIVVNDIRDNNYSS